MMIKDYRKEIMELLASKEYQNLSRFYRPSIFEKIGISRLERVHSEFWRWMLDSSESHSLGGYPAECLLRVLLVADENKVSTALKDENVELFKRKIILGEKMVIESNVSREETINYNSSNKRIDLLIKMKIKNMNKVLIICIENKVKSKENDEQTVAYYEGVRDIYKDANILYVYLTPKSIETLKNGVECECKDFIQIDYQLLTKHILQPVRIKINVEEDRNLIENYIRCLSRPALEDSDDVDKGKKAERGYIIMSMDEKEKVLLREFYFQHKELLMAVISSLEEEESGILNEFFDGLPEKSSKDYTKYEFDGKPYNKTRLMWAVAKKYATENKDVSLDDMKKIFDKNKVCSKSDAIKNNEKSNIKRWLTKPDEIIKLKNGEEIAMSNQWTKALVDEFIRKKQKNHIKYEILELEDK